MLAYGTTWVNAMDCRFEDNQVGFRFNAEGTVITHTQYANNEFFHNGTAVLLKRTRRKPPVLPRQRVPGTTIPTLTTAADGEVNISQTTFR